MMPRTMCTGVSMPRNRLRSLCEINLIGSGNTL